MCVRVGHACVCYRRVPYAMCVCVGGVEWLWWWWGECLLRCLVGWYLTMFLFASKLTVVVSGTVIIIAPLATQAGTGSLEPALVT
jgi:hypothetical protein